MRFKDIFSIIGPAMVGPSSSHTAGAVRLGRVGRMLLGEQPEQAEIVLFGSFADTYKGHGTDLALAAGLLDYDTDDLRIPNSLEEAARLGMDITFHEKRIPGPHPNTAAFRLLHQGREISYTGASIGGGNIEILKVNGFDVRFSANYPTLLILHEDRLGMIADVAQLLRVAGINIGYMHVDRKARHGSAMTVVELDNDYNEEVIRQLTGLPFVHEVIGINLRRRGGT